MQHKRAILSGLCLAALRRGTAGFTDLQLASRAASAAAKRTPTALNRSIPVRTIGDVLNSRKVDIRLTVQAYTDGQLPMEEAIALVPLLVLAQPKIILEIGTFNGQTTRLMAMNLPNTRIHTVDLPVDFQEVGNPDLPKDDFHLIAQRKVGQAFHDTEFAERIAQHFGDSATWDFTLAAGATFFFIDGSHTYEYCKSDSEKCFDLCQGKGTFVWHDCDDMHPGVLQFLAEWRALGRDIVRIDQTALCYWSSL